MVDAACQTLPGTEIVEDVTDVGEVVTRRVEVLPGEESYINNSGVNNPTPFGVTGLSLIHISEPTRPY